MLRLLIRYLSDYRILLIIFFTGVIFELVFQYLLALSFKFLLDAAITPGNMDVLVLVLLMLLAFGTLSILIGFLNDQRMAKLGTRISEDLRSQSFSHIQRQGVSFLNRFRISELVSRFQHDIPAIERFMIRLLSIGVPALLSVMIGLVFLFFIQPWMTLLVLVGIIMIFIPNYTYTDEEDLYIDMHAKEEEALGDAVEDYTGNMKLIHAFNAVPAFSSRFQELLSGLSDTHLKYVRLKSKMHRLPQVILLLFRMLVLGIGGYLTFTEVLTLGDFVAYFTIFLLIFQQAIVLSSTIALSSQPSVNWQRFEELMRAGEEHEEETAGLDPGPVQQGITFKDVSYHYEGSDLGVESLNLTFPKGSYTVITGPSGSGKSSLVHLLLKFYSPRSGTVELDGRNIRDLDTQTFRSKFAVVFQEPYFIEGSIRENLEMHSDTAYTDEDLHRALDMAGAGDVVRRMKDGLDTKIRTKVRALSGGEEQRIALARALLTKPDFLVLDEATSALDPRSEADVVNMIESLPPDVTVISLTHRLQYGKNADQVIVMENGIAVEQGTHKELVHAGGLYQHLLAKQQGFSLSDNGMVASVEGERLHRIGLFSSLEKSYVYQLSERFITEIYEAGEAIVHEGDLGDRFYLIARGKVSVRIGGVQEHHQVAVLEDGDHFGELALLYDEPRNATILPMERTTCLALHTEDFHAMLSEYPSVRKQIETIAKKRLIPVQKEESAN